MRVGFIGTGLIATYHSKSLRRGGADVERAGAYDVDATRLAAFVAASGHRMCDTEEEVLDSCDAVYVCTWTSEHPRLVEAAAERGLAVFCEKPLATSLATAESMAATVARAGVVNQVGLVLRRSPAFTWARRLVTDAAAGRLMTVVFRDDQFIPIQGHYSSDWRADRDRAGSGTLLEHSIHDVDMLRYLTGEAITTVSAHAANFHGLPGIEDVVSASMRFAGGATGTLTSVWHDNLARPSLRRVEVFCERRLVVIDGDDWFGPVRWTDSDGASGELGGEELAAAAARLVDGGLNPDVAFVAAVTDGGPAWPDFATAVDAHRVVDAIYRSASGSGEAVDIPGMTSAVDIVELDTAATYDLRRRVLRAGTPSTDVTYAQDDLAGTFHLGALHEGTLVGVSSWAVEAWPDEPTTPAVRLRGMAVEPRLQGTGAGTAMVVEGVHHVGRGGAALVWATARDAVLGFYERCGFDVVGDGFIDGPTALPHHVVVRRL